MILQALIWLLSVVACIAAIFLIAQFPQNAGGNWPVTPVSSDHPIANTYGELFGQPYPALHGGVDILAGASDGIAPPDIVTIADGTIVSCPARSSDGSFVVNDYNNVVVEAAGGTPRYKYTYQHLNLSDPNLPATLGVACASNGGLVKGTVIGKVENAFPGNCDHLHLDMVEVEKDNGGNYLDKHSVNPLVKIGPEPDFIPPDVVDVFLARHLRLPNGNWNVFTPGVNSTEVSGTVDIIAKVTDSDDAGSAEPAAGHVGVYDVKWRACPIANPDCDWNDTYRFDVMTAEFGENIDTFIRQHFSFAPNWVTTLEDWSSGSSVDCPVTVPNTFIVVAKDGGVASWDTTEPIGGNAKKYPDGQYLLSVKALDYGAKEDIETVSVCVKNNAATVCPP